MLPVARRTDPAPDTACQTGIPGQRQSEVDARRQHHRPVPGGLLLEPRRRSRDSGADHHEQAGGPPRREAAGAHPRRRNDRFGPGGTGAVDDPGRSAPGLQRQTGREHQPHRDLQLLPHPGGGRPDRQRRDGGIHRAAHLREKPTGHRRTPVRGGSGGPGRRAPAGLGREADAIQGGQPRREHARRQGGAVLPGRGGALRGAYRRTQGARRPPRPSGRPGLVA